MVIRFIRLMFIVSGKLIENMFSCGVMCEMMFSIRFMNISIVISGSVIYNLIWNILVFYICGCVMCRNWKGLLLMGKVWKLVISVLISIRWLLIVMNRKVIIVLRKCDDEVFCVLVDGLKKFVKFKFICRLISLFVNLSEVNISWIVKFMDRLISSCCVIVVRICGVEFSGMVGIVGSEGCVVIVMNSVRLICICVGMLCWLKIGMFENSVSVCRKGYRIGLI